MKMVSRALLLAAFLAAPAAPSALGQAISYEMEELKRLAGQVEDLRASWEAQQQRLRDLERENENLRSALRRLSEETSSKMAGFVTRSDLKNLADAIAEVDRKREADRNVILEEIKTGLAKVAASTRNETRRNDPPASPPPSGEFHEHIVEAGQNLSMILDAYNAAFKQDGRQTVSLADVKRANPNINIDRIYVGQKIYIPSPPPAE